jgi:hypothetical protein
MSPAMDRFRPLQKGHFDFLKYFGRGRNSSELEGGLSIRNSQVFGRLDVERRMCRNGAARGAAQIIGRNGKIDDILGALTCQIANANKGPSLKS